MNHKLAAALLLMTLTVAGIPMSRTAQATTASSERTAHRSRYRLVDLGTFGGPNSAETVEFPFINNRGMVVGFADTASPDPNTGGLAFHAFRWRGRGLEDLGTLDGGVNSFAIWSNEAGVIAGLSETGEIDPQLGVPAAHGVVWNKDGRITDLGTFGGAQSLAADLNDRSQVVGVAANTVTDQYSLFEWATQTRAFMWDRGVLVDLGTLGGPDASAKFVNGRGQVAGMSYTDATPNETTGKPTLHPFLWQHGTMLDLGTLGGTWSSPNGLNDRGQVVGESNLSGDETAHPFLWDRGRLRDLGTLGGSFGVANWLNNAGTVVGGAQTEDGLFHAFSWDHGTMHDLGTVGDDTCSVAHFTNARGQAVGSSGDCRGEFEQHGFVAENGRHMIDLNTLVDPTSTITVIDGETVNDRGEIAGSGLLPNGDLHAIVLIPLQ